MDRLGFNPNQYMIMRGHQTIAENIYMLANIHLKSAQKIQIIITFKEYRLAVIAAIIKKIILVGQEGNDSAGHNVTVGFDYIKLCRNGNLK